MAEYVYMLSGLSERKATCFPQYISGQRQLGQGAME